MKKSKDFSDVEREDYSDISEQHEDTEFEDHEVLGIGSSDEDEALRKVPGLRRRIGRRDDDEERVSNDEQEDERAWGRKKAVYYNDDEEDMSEASDDDDSAAEEDEAERLQTAQIKELQDEDFLDLFQAAGDDASKTTEGGHCDDDLLIEWAKDDQEAVISADSPELLDLMEDFKEKIQEVRKHAEILRERLQSDEIPSCKALTFLHFKNQLMLSYLLNLSYFFYLKSRGKPVKSHPVVEKLVALRLYMEKSKPIEQKLSHEISKLVQHVNKEAAERDELDAISLKANPDMLHSEDDEDRKEAVYTAPKIAPVRYEEKFDKKQKEDREKSHKIAKSSRLMADFMEDFNEAPEEVLDAGNVSLKTSKSKMSKMMEARMKAEEDMLARLPLTRKDKRKLKDMSGYADELQILDDIGDPSLSNIVEEEDPYYQRVKEEREYKIKARKEADQPAILYDSEEEEDGKRAIGYDIMKNKGLTPVRKKEDRNPRVKRRKKYEKSMIKLKSMKRTVQSQDKPYAGEESGIRRNLAKSVRL